MSRVPRRSSRLLLALALVGAFTAGIAVSSLNLMQPSAAVAQGDCQTFSETGKTVCGIFLTYWRTHGGLAQQGYPISDVFQEKSDIDGKTYDVQYFERAVFERHPENAGTEYEVLLTLLGREKFERKYPSGRPGGEVPLQAGQSLVLPGNKAGNTIQVVINEVQRTSSIGNTAANGVFVVVHMTATNLGAESDGIRQFKIRDAQGRTFDQSFEGILAGIGEFPTDSINITSLQPSVPTGVYNVFDVAIDATEFVIVPSN